MNLIEINQKLGELNEWSLEGSSIQKTFDFNTFKEAVTFVNNISEIAEEENHHPDINIRFTSVSVFLTTHSAKGLTEKDFSVARKIDQIS